MKLSIITINRNNASGLEKTLKSVATQTCKDFEHIIIDGASTDNSVEVIKHYVESTNNPSPITQPQSPVTNNPSPITHHPSPIACYQIKWISEPDKGIYNAMNKGIRMASGDYIQILNSGDSLFNEYVVERMLAALEEKKYPEILYGNMIKQWTDGRTRCDCCEQGKLTMLSFYHGTLNHDPTYIQRNLFEKFGYYDENLKIVSDWEWYLKAIPLGGVQPVYVNLNVTIFDMTGVSESNTAYWKVERRPVLERELPPMILADYDRYADDMRMMDRINRHHLHGVVRFMERVLFKLEKWHILKK